MGMKWQKVLSDIDQYQLHWANVYKESCETLVPFETIKTRTISCVTKTKIDRCFCKALCFCSAYSTIINEYVPAYVKLDVRERLNV